MTTYGVTPTGFVTKRLADIKGELETSARATFGVGIDLAAESPLGQLIGIISEREAFVWGVAEDVYNSAYPDTASGVSLDNAVALTGVKRKPATKSVVSATLLGTAGTLIPKGSIAAVSGNETARFVLNADATIAAAIIEVQKIAFDHVPTGGAWRVTWNGLQTGSLAYGANAAAVQAALRLLAGLASVTVTGDYTVGFTITFAGTVGDQPQVTVTGSTLTYASGSVVATPSTLTPGVPAEVVATMTAETAGAVRAPAGSMTLIKTPVSGWASVTNAADATVGNEIEIDSALKTRRALSIESGGTGTIDAIRSDILKIDNVVSCLIFENTTSGVVSGRPAKSFEAIVLGGIDASIAQVIWDDKPAGIASYGSTTVSVNDSQGFAHNVSFSRPTQITIYLEIDLTTDTTFPSGGAAAVKAAIIAYATALAIGDDVVVYPTLMAAIATVKGITDVAIRIGTSASPTLDNNIVIGATERAAFDTSRILVTLL